MIRQTIFYNGVDDYMLIRHDVLAKDGRFVHTYHKASCIDDDVLSTSLRSAQYAFGRFLGKTEIEDISLCYPQNQKLIDVGPIMPFAFNGKAKRAKTDTFGGMRYEHS